MRDIKAPHPVSPDEPRYPEGPRSPRPQAPAAPASEAGNSLVHKPSRAPAVVRQQASGPRWQVGHRERLIVAGLLLLTAVVGGLAAIIFWPKAEIELLLRTAPLLVEETLAITAEAGTAGNNVPGSVFFRELRVEGTVPVEGREVIGEKASGTVAIINRTTEEQKIVSGSRLVTDEGELFLTQSAVTVPPGGADVGTAQVAVEAAEAGSAGNLEAGTRLNFAALDSSAQSVVYAEARDLAGGSGDEVAVVTATDIEAAREAAQGEARQRVEADIRAEIAEGWVLMEESWVVELGNFEAGAAEGERVAELPFVAQASVHVMGYEQVVLEQKLQRALESRLDEEYVLFPGAISYTKSVKNVNWEQGRAEVAVRVTHTTMPDFSLETLRSKLAGQSRTEAQQYLEGLPGVRSATLELSPFWVQSVPRVERRIMIQLTPERQP